MLFHLINWFAYLEIPLSESSNHILYVHIISRDHIVTIIFSIYIFSGKCVIYILPIGDNVE